MKIGIVLGGYYRHQKGQGGAEVQTALLIDHFLGKGHQIVYLCYGDRSSETPEEVSKSLRIYRVKRPFLNRKSLMYVNKGFIYRILDRENVDVLYQRGDFHFSDLISRYGRERKIPVVSAISMEKHCHRGRIKFGPFMLLDLIFERRRSTYFRWSDMIVSQTNHQRDRLKKNMGFDSIVIPNGYPSGIANIGKDDPPVVIWVANIKPIKQPDIFVKLANDLNDCGAKFKMVGRPLGGDFQRELEAGIENVQNLQYLGELPLEETEKEISKAFILVNTSFSEGFSNTYLQAWMRGTVVVGLNSDPDDMMKENRIGFHSGSYEKLVKDVTDLLSHPERMEEVARRSREFSLENFDI
ncbi:MAG: glycosyltransferase family 4 protein, partial [Thermoplasmata archaeon]|nr:glycosyltransferase family 4 protein [Thermoplasmata archaeon]